MSDVVDEILAKEEKERRISVEIKRLTGLFKKMNQDTKKVVKSLITNAAFMAITLEDLQEHIAINGVTDKYQNGENQWGVKKSPQVEIYNTMVKNHASIMKQLADLMPKHTQKPEGDGFDDFVNER